MSLGSIVSNIGNSQMPQPLLLAAITLQGTSTPLLLSSHSLDGTAGPTFPGIGPLPSGQYLGRVYQQTIDALVSRSQLGIDRVAKVTLRLWDADHFLYNNICKVYGFRGATMQLVLVLWQAGTTNFSSDALLVFTGTCDMELPKQGLTVIDVNANTSHNTAVIKLSTFPNQNRCPLHFPATDAEQTMSLDPASDFCMYAAAVGGPGNTFTPNYTNMYGNVITDSRGIFKSCEFLRSSPSDPGVGCMARLGNPSGTSIAPDGDIGHDTHGNWTGGFAGIQWSPGIYYSTPKNYTSNSRIAAFSFLNAAVLGTYQNLVYGQQFINAKIATIVESGNDTKMEAMIYAGEHDLGYVPFVVVNGVEVNRFGHGAVDGSLGWDWANDGTNFSTGGRKGTPLHFVGYNDPSHAALGDPFGSICRVGIVVYKELFTGFGLPTVQVRTIGPKIAVFTSQTTKTLLGAPYNSNPSWVTLDILKKANWAYSEVNIASFIACAPICNQNINYIDQNGATVQHARFKCQFSLETRKTAATVISSVLKCFNGYLYYETDGTGLLSLGILMTLADQQPSAMIGSNYNTPISSITALGAIASGFAAYLFDETNINLKTLQFESNATVMTPNRININFQDEDNSFVADSLNDVDANSVLRAGGTLNPGGAVIDETLEVEGISNFDQAFRISNVYLAERQYGNEANDPRGTRIITFETTVRCAYVRTGHIVIWSSVAYGITRQMMRVLEITPNTNFQTAKVKLQWHNDIWYTDAYGQDPQAFYSNAGLARNPGPPRVWMPTAEQPSVPAGAAFPDLSFTEENFKVSEIDLLDANGGPLIKLQVDGMLPINSISSGLQPPRVPTQSTLSGGGSIPANKIVYIKLSSTDNSFQNFSSASATITSPVTTGSNSIVVSNIGWPTGATKYALYAGFDHFSLSLQATGAVSSTITLSSMSNVAVKAPPDLNADSVYLQSKLAIHAGIVGSNVGAVSVSPNHITIGGPPSGSFTNVLSGYKLFLVGRQTLAGAPLPLISFDASHGSGDGNVITVDRDPTSLIHTQDVVIVSAQANIASANSIGDVNFVSAFAPFGVSPDGIAQPDVGMIIRIVWGNGRYQTRTITGVIASTGGTNFDTYTVDSPWSVIPDATSSFIVEESTWPHFTTAQQFNQSTYQITTAGQVEVSNYAKRVVLIQALIYDATDTLAVERRAPFRLIYLTGAQGTKILTHADSPYTQTITDGFLQCDTSGGDVTIQLLSYVLVPNVELTIQKLTPDANVVTINWATGEEDFNGDTTRQLSTNTDPGSFTEITFPSA